AELLSQRRHAHGAALRPRLRPVPGHRRGPPQSPRVPGRGRRRGPRPDPRTGGARRRLLPQRRLRPRAAVPARGAARADPAAPARRTGFRGPGRRRPPRPHRRNARRRPPLPARPLRHMPCVTARQAPQINRAAAPASRLPSGPVDERTTSMERTRGFARLAGLAVVPVLLAACGPSSEVQQQLAQLEAVSAEKDSLLLQVAENARLMSDIAAEIARVQTPRTATVGGQEPTPVAITRENLLQNIQQLTTRLEESVKRLAESEQRIHTLTRDAQGTQSRIAEFRRTIQGLQSTIENQKQTIATLTEQVNALQEENVRLAAENTQLVLEKSSLEQTLSEIEERESTVYYVIGTKDELIERGLVTEEGGSRVLF